MKRNNSSLIATVVAGLGVLIAGCSDSEAGYDNSTAEDRPAVEDVRTKEPDADAQNASPQGERARKASNPAREGELEVAGADGTPLLTVRRTGTTEARVGESFEYELVVKNVSGAPVHDIELEQVVHGDALANANDGDENDSGNKVWKVGTLEAGAERTHRMSARAVEAGTGKMCILVDYRPALCVPVQVTKPQLELTRVVGEGPFFVCDDVPMQYMVRNVGSGNSKSFTVEEKLPEGLVTKDGKRTISFQVDEVGSDQPFTRDVVLTPEKGGTYKLRAQANLGENRALDTGDRELVILDPELALHLDAPKQEFVGRTTDVRVTVENTSDDPARDVILTVTGVEKMANASYRGGEMEKDGTIRIGDLDAGESRTFTIRGELNQPMEAQITARAVAYCVDQVEKTAAITVKGLPALQIEVIDTIDPVEIDGETEYHIRIWNEGTAASVSLNVEATLPKTLDFVAARGATEGKNDGKKITFAKLQRLEPGEAADWFVRARGVSEGQDAFDLQVTSDALSQTIRNQEPTRVY